MEPAVAAVRTCLSPAIREARFDDYDGIAALQARNGLDSRPYDEWLNLWAANPAYAARPPAPIGWVLEGSDGTIGGYLGNLPLDYQLGGRTIHAATHYSWVVEPAYRAHSLTLMTRFLRQTGADLFISTTPNTAAGSVLRALRFRQSPSGRWDQAGFWVTGHYGFAQSVLRSAPRRIPSVLAYPLAAALYLVDILRRHPGAGQADGLDFEVCGEFDARFDEFWNQLCVENENRLLAVRSQAALQWHFAPALKRSQARILAAHRHHRMVAYAVVDRRDNAALGLNRYRIADFQSLRGYEGWLSTALGWVLLECRRQGIHIAENAGCWLERYQVPGAAPWYQRRLQSWLFYYQARAPHLDAQLLNPQVWMPSLYDGDSSL